MKKLTLLLAAVLGFAVLAPATASAGGGHCRPGSTRVSYDSCGRQIVSVYTFVGRSYDGCPVFRWIAQPCYDRPVYRGDGYGRGGYGRGDGYGRGGYGDRGGYDRGGYDRRGGGDRCDPPRRGGYLSIRIGR